MCAPADGKDECVPGNYCDGCVPGSFAMGVSLVNIATGLTLVIIAMGLALVIAMGVFKDSYYSGYVTRNFCDGCVPGIMVSMGVHLEVYCQNGCDPVITPWEHFQ